jgi:hypothetical protein
LLWPNSGRSGKAEVRDLRLLKQGLLMFRAKASFAAVAAVSATVLSGCYSFPPYGSYPGAYPAAPSAYPQQSLVMPGDVVGSPAVTTGQPGQSTFTPSGTLEAPKYEPRSESAPPMANPVPQPRDPGPDAATMDDPAERTSQKVEPTEADDLSSIEPERLQFAEPIVRSTEDVPADGIVAVSLEQEAQALAGASGLERDVQFRWVQGIVEYDKTQRSWHLIYDLEPAVTDTLGGEITLDGRLPLTESDNGRLIRVSGQFDPSRLDRLNKPVYRVSRLEPVVAR